LPVSTVQRGCYGLQDVALSVPTVVGRGGAEQTLEVELWPKEIQALKRSGAVLQETLGKVLAGAN
jgi:L-lactate dehydrogenase